ncbi:MAG: ABC transporter permease [Spirochaetales bacterium]|uniref:ABC transporter permease n=1 Tax=Candidatus Thalassospirochaeta sargassi TaxID=3119039 RepID=A0AAJ1MLN0_9SPIO|nr:ABC transporter permease [Spirochaetales bacterium]
MILLLTSILAITLRAGTSLVFATIGEIYTEKSGVLNLGIEGIMLMSAVLSFTVSYYTGNLFAAVVTAMATGAVLSLLHAFLSITMRAQQVVSGLSITLFGTGMASFLGQTLGPESNSGYMIGLTAAKFETLTIPGLSKLPVIGAVFNQDLLTYIVLLLIPVAWYFMFRTKYGLNLRAVGESPQTADAMGIDVTRTRYIYTIFGGIMAGIGGAHLSLAYTPGWTENITGGRGWIVIALVIFSLWNPSRAIWGAILFGGINAVQFRLQASGAEIPAPVLNMMPYLVTIVVLIIITLWENRRRGTGTPAALGTPYQREEK